MHAALCKRAMAFMLARLNGRDECLIADRKRTLLSDLSGIVLEIDPETRPNLAYHPLVQRQVRPISEMLADGCCPDRETWEATERAGFERVDYQRFRLPLPIVGPHIAGAAIEKT